MAIARSALLVELLMSVDRVITAAQSATTSDDPDAWSPAVVVGHLSQVDEQVWIPRLNLMAESIDSAPPEFTWWEPDPVATAEAFRAASVDDASAQLLASRTRLLHLLRDFTDTQWRATALHDVFGEIDVEALTLRVLAHDEEHRATLLLGGGRD